ncbi:unnamed protein product [Sphagnum jensenii]|uniref:Ycf20-like protein n=1 Tax=Sphagnum jensenii TaxID=128206 RepID=A0ABP1C195_9BRYO
MTTFCRAPLCQSFATTLVFPSSAAAAAASSSSVLQHRARNWTVLLSPVFRIKRLERRRCFNIVRSTLDSTGTPGGGDSGSTDSSRNNLGSTRIGRLVSARCQDLLKRWNTVRRNFPAKVFLLLLGFFSANALATILGQTGDWDVLAAGVLVALIEGIGYLMYRMPLFLGNRGKMVVEFVNYWKAGFSFGLFVDAFKVGS